MNALLKYWGGKAQLCDKILPLITRHQCYVEPFFGGGSVFFEKPKAKIEIINDINENIINFYRVFTTKYEELKGEIDATLYSESDFKAAKKIWKGAQTANDVRRAWAVFILSHQCINSNFDGGWRMHLNKDTANSFTVKKRRINEMYLERLRGVQIFCRDALSVIKTCDSKDTFFFIDPPYFNVDMGHYEGYTETDFIALLNVLQEVKGKWLLTTYPSEILSEQTRLNQWHTVINEIHLSSSSRSGKMKTEVFTTNYIPYQQMNLF
jgi:DNA adenine methylase